jgi:hypothetical protein
MTIFKEVNRREKSGEGERYKVCVTENSKEKKRKKKKGKEKKRKEKKRKESKEKKRKGRVKRWKYLYITFPEILLFNLYQNLIDPRYFGHKNNTKK